MAKHCSVKILPSQDQIHDQYQIISYHQMAYLDLDAFCFISIFRPNSGTKSVCCIVCPFYHFFFSAKLRNSSHWTKYFFLKQRVVIWYVPKQCWLDKKSFGVDHEKYQLIPGNYIETKIFSSNRNFYLFLFRCLQER